MTEPAFRVRVTKDHLVFSAAHFITFNGSICERLHGHNWRVAVEVAGPLDENRYVFDFIALLDQTRQLVNQLDHRVLLPLSHPRIRVESRPRESGSKHDEVWATFEDRRWIFPAEDCFLLPVANTTAEEIALWLARRLQAGLQQGNPHRLHELQVSVEENFGQWAVCSLPLDRPASF